jgi:hypothetical protein
MLIAQGNIASTYSALERFEEALSLKQEVYSGFLKRYGEEHEIALRAANNYASSLIDSQRSEEAKALMRKTIPVARRVLGESNKQTLKMRWHYAITIFEDDGATIDDLCEAVETLESVEPSWKRVFGDINPETTRVQEALAHARGKLAQARAA